MTGVEPLKKFLKSQRLRWFGYVKKMSKEKALAMAMKIMMKDKKKDLRNNRWRLLKKTWEEDYNKNGQRKVRVEAWLQETANTWQ